MAPAILALVLVAILLLLGNPWIWAALVAGTLLIVFVCFVLLSPKRYAPHAKVKMRSCEACGGAGALRLIVVDRKATLVKIPRSEWEAATWRYANLQTCIPCQGSGNVPKRSGRTPNQ